MKQIYRYILSALMLLTGTTTAFAYWEGSGQGINKNGTWYALYDNTERSLGLGDQYDYTLSAPGANLTFDGKRTVAGIGDLRVSENVNGNYNTIFEKNVGESETYWDWGIKVRVNYVNYSASVNVNATKLRYSHPIGGSLTKYFKNVHVTMATYCAPASTATINFGEGQYMVTTDKTLKIYWCNVADNAVVSITGTDAARFSVNKTRVGSSVGKYGNTLITITYKRDNLPAGQTQKTHTATLKVNGQSITLTGKTIAVTPDITCPTLTNKVNSQSPISGFTWTGGTAEHPTLHTSVTGTFAWVDGSQKANCHGSYQVRFTPDASLYGGGYTTVTCIIDLEGEDRITPIAQTLTWVPLDVETVDAGSRIYQIDGGRRLHAATNGDGEVRYKFISRKNLNGVEDASVADLLREDGGRFTNLIMNKPGTVVLEAWADSTCNYNESNHIQTTFRMPELINLLTNGLVSPVCDPIIWGQTLQDANARGTATYYETESLSENVPGHFEWLSPYYQPEVNESPGWDRKLRFVPDDRERFRIVTVDIKVIVKKRNTNITYISCPLWRGQSSYSHPFRSNNNESAYSVTVSPNDGVVSWNAATQSIVVRTVQTEQQYTLTVTQAASAHYNAGTLTVTCWVRRRSDVCLPVVQFKNDYGEGTLNPEIYNKMRVSGEGTWSFEEKDDNKEEYFLYVANVMYTTHRGMQFGTWKDGFDLTSTLVLHINTSTEPVKTRLYFTGVPDKLDIKSKSESATTYTLFWTIPTTWSISNRSWKVAESTNGTNFTSEIIPWTNGSELDHSNVRLNPDSRYIEITYYGNFAGYVPAEDFHLTLRQQFEQGADRHQVKSIDIPQFGTEAHPLQVPQQVTFRYYGMGACGGVGERLKIESDNEAFYADMEYITENVGIDSWGEYTLNLRCTDVGKSGHITITPVDSEDNPIRDPHGNPITPLTINVSSASPQITNATKTTQIFDTGTEQFPKGDDLYYGLRKHDFSDCFNSAGQPVFDYLYIFGVTGSSEQKISKRFGDYDFTDPTGYFDPVKEYWLPRFDVPDATHGCNAHTPCFVYRKNGNKYVYDHTTKVHTDNFDNIDITGKKVYVSGYCPFAYTGKDMTDGGFMNFTGDNGHVYLQDAIIYARHHNTSGKSTYDEPQELTLYLGNNVFSGNGAVMNFSNATATTIHLAGNSIIQATGGAKVGTITGWSRGIEVPFGVSNFKVPAPAIAFKPSSPHDSWQLTVDNQWADGSVTDGTLILSGSKGGGCIDIGTELSPEPVIAKIEDEPIVYLTPMADEYMTLLTSPDAVYGGFENTKNVYCRLLMDEKNGQGFSLYGVGNDYSPSADAWTAALPDRSFTAESGQTRMVYFDLGGETRGDLQNTTSFIAGRNTAADRQYMVQRVDADSWQTTTAPFDIHSVYLLEAMPESVLQATGSRTTAINEQNKVLVELLEYLEHDLPEGAKAVSADKSLVVLISNWIGERRDGTTAFDDSYTGDKKVYMQRGLLPLTQYDGTNLWSADWYLYEIDGEQTWELRAEQDGPSRFNAEWKPVKRGAGDALMQKGRVYSWRLPYCSMCGVNDDYDYWSGKWLIFEGRTQRAAIDGTTESGNGMKAASTSAKSASGKGYFAGNTSLSGVRPPVGAFIHDQNPTSETYDCFVPFSGSDITPTTACIFLGVSAPAGMRVSAIKRSGEIVYGEAGSDVATAVANLSGDESSFVAYSAAAGSLIIETTVATDVRVYGVDGRLVASAVLGAGDTTQFNVASGMYVVGNANGETRKVIVR